MGIAVLGKTAVELQSQHRLSAARSAENDAQEATLGLLLDAVCVRAG